MKEIDIDRLHSVIEDLEAGNTQARGAGTTFAELQLLIGELEVGDWSTNHLVVVHSAQWASSLCRWFSELLRDREIKHRMLDRNILTEKDQYVWFMHLTADFDAVLAGRKFRTATFDIPTEVIDIPSNMYAYIASRMED